MSLRAQTLAVLRQSDLLRFLTARFLATIAAQMQVVAVGWQMYDITGDPLDLGFIGLSQFLPFVALILPAGQVADHFARSRIVTLCYLTAAACAAALLVFTLRGLNAPGPVFAVMVLLGATRAFAMPATSSLLPNLVPPADFTRAVALNSSVFQIAGMLGPALGGVVYLAGPAAVYGTVAILAAIAAVLMLQIRGGRRSVGQREPISWQTLLSGLRFVRSKPVVLGAISLDLFAVLFGGATALLPVYASDVLHIGPSGLGLLRTAPGIGAALCAFALAVSPIGRNVGAWMFGGVAAFGAATIVFGLSTNFALSLFALTILGAADMVSVYVRHLLVQLETPDEIRGRVSAGSAVFIGASNELGDFESGVTAKWWGAIRAVVIGGAATLAVTVGWMKLFPMLRHMHEFPPRAS